MCTCSFADLKLCFLAHRGEEEFTCNNQEERKATTGKVGNFTNKRDRILIMRLKVKNVF